MDRQEREALFRARLARQEEELRSLYLELYSGDGQAYAYFTQMLRHAFDDRSEEMLELDRRRAEDPRWYKGRDLVGMLMYVDCFAGTLDGVREKLGYLEETGVNYLHLMPLLKSPAGRSDGGYAVADFRTVQPELGSMEDLSALASECHRRGIAVCLDFVMNHTSEDHEWAVRARAGEKEYQDRYFFFDNWAVPLEYEKTVPQVFPTTAPGNFTWCQEAGKVVMTTFYPYQWDLNYRNPVVFNDMTDNKRGALYLEGAGHQLPQSPPSAHPGAYHAHGLRDRVPRYPAAGRSGDGAQQGGALLRQRGQARVPSALQCDHHGQHLAHRGHP